MCNMAVPPVCLVLLKLCGANPPQYRIMAVFAHFSDSRISGMALCWLGRLLFLYGIAVCLLTMKIVPSKMTIQIYKMTPHFFKMRILVFKSGVHIHKMGISVYKMTAHFLKMNISGYKMAVRLLSTRALLPGTAFASTKYAVGSSERVFARIERAFADTKCASETLRYRSGE